MTLILDLPLTAPPPGARDVRRRLHAELRGAILEGRLLGGLRLPASRALAQALGVSRNTVVAVYELLLSEGYVVSRTGAGTFVAKGLAARRPAGAPAGAGPDARWLHPAWRTPLKPRRLPMPGVRHDLRLGTPDTSRFPFDVWGRLCGQALRGLVRVPASDGEPGGRRALREAIAAHVSYTRAVACGPDDIVVTVGAQQAFDLLARVLTKEHGVVALEDPGYQQTRIAFERAGARLALVPVDEAGLAVDLIPDQAAVICVTPSHQFPLGVVMSADRRQALLAHAARTGALIVEDDYDSEFRFAGRPLDALQTLDREGRVFYVGTFGKSMFPAVRLGFIVAPPWARPALISARQVADGHGPALEQDALAAFISQGHLARHVRTMQRVYDERRRALLTALEARAADLLQPLPALAGLHLSAVLKRPIDAAVVAARAAERGLAVNSLTRRSPGAPPIDAIALGYGQIGVEAVDDAIRTLAEAVAAA